MLFNLSPLLLVIPPSGPLYTLSRSNLSAHFYKLEALMQVEGGKEEQTAQAYCMQDSRLGNGQHII